MRSLLMLVFSENSVGPDFARMVFSILLGSLPDLATFEVSDSNVVFLWIAKYLKSTCCRPQIKSMKSLRYLNLRGDNFHANDAEDLKCILAHTPNLQSLDNPIGDLGISDVARPLAKFLGTSQLKLLNVEDIELGPSGFLELEREMPTEVGIVNVNISKNRGCTGATKFVARLILQASELVSVNASYNFIPVVSMDIIAGAMKLSKGTLNHLDLTGNVRCCLPICKSLFEEFQNPGNSVVILHSSPVLAVSYDDDPLI